MAKFYYKNRNPINIKKSIKVLGFLLISGGALLFLYSFLPLISWQIYFAPVFASQKIQAPIPRITVLDTSQIQNLILQAKNNIVLDYTNASSWYPTFTAKDKKTKELDYNLSIPKLGLEKLLVSTKDLDLKKHLVNYPGTSIPPDKGNAVIFGHSTLPQLFNSKDYKTVFATLYKMAVGDEILVILDKVTYKYKVFQIIVVNPEDTWVLEQNFNDKILTLVTCTPPGTVWKRLVIKAKIEKI